VSGDPRSNPRRDDTLLAISRPESWTSGLARYFEACLSLTMPYLAPRTCAGRELQARRFFCLDPCCINPLRPGHAATRPSSDGSDVPWIAPILRLASRRELMSCCSACSDFKPMDWFQYRYPLPGPQAWAHPAHLLNISHPVQGIKTQCCDTAVLPRGPLVPDQHFEQISPTCAGASPFPKSDDTPPSRPRLK
jgi:hypothetical protein